MTGTYDGDGPQTLRVRLPGLSATDRIRVKIDGRPADGKIGDDLVVLTLPPSSGRTPCRFEIIRMPVR
jgi:hypothetical protein